MATLQGLAHEVLKNRVGASAVTLIVGFLSTDVIVFAAWRWERSEQNSDNLDVMYAAAIVASLVTGFHMFTHDLSPLVLAMCLVMAQIRQQGTKLRVVLWAIFALLWFFPPTYFFLIARHYMYLLFPVLMAFWALTLRVALKSPTGDTYARSLSANASC